MPAIYERYKGDFSGGYESTTLRAPGLTPSTPQVFTGGYVDTFMVDRPTYARAYKPVGWLYPKAYETTVSSLSIAPGRHQWRLIPGYTQVGKVNGYNLRGNLETLYGSIPATQWAKNPTHRDRAVTDALLKLKDQKVNLGQAYRERVMTADLLSDSIARIARSVQLFRKGDLRGVSRALRRSWRQAPQTWLELQYGWTPLLNDVYGSCEALANRNQQRDWITTVKGIVVERETEAWINEPIQGYRSTIERKRSRGAFVRLDYVPGNTFLSTLSQVGLTNPLQLQWELVPFSFVVDWFLPIGDWLSSMDAAIGYQFLSGSITHREETTHLQTTKGNPFPYDFYYDIGQQRSVIVDDYRASRRDFHMKREVLTSSPLPMMPRLKNPLSLGHAANGLALLSQLLGRGKPRVR